MAWHKSRGEKEREGKRRKKKREQKRSKVGGTKMGRKDEEIGRDRKYVETQKEGK